MSQWTHVTGIIHYDYRAKNMWCSDTDGRPASYDPKSKLKILKNLYKGGPSGSEGGIEVNIINAGRGFAVVLLADLRDFGFSDVRSICDWLNKIQQNLNLYTSSLNNIEDALTIRSVSIKVDVEYYEGTLSIELVDEKWVLKSH